MTKLIALKCYKIPCFSKFHVFVWAPTRAKAIWACVRSAVDAGHDRQEVLTQLHAKRYPDLDGKMPPHCKPLTPHSEDYVMDTP